MFGILLSCLFFQLSVDAQKIKQPNIILILADDLRYADISSYGQQKIKTPNIDQLAKEGLKFNRFYLGSTVCSHLY